MQLSSDEFIKLKTMQTFIAIHHNGIAPAFTSFPTVAAAETYLNELLSTRRVSTTDSLAIVRASDDKIIYFRPQNNTLDNLRAGLNRRANVLRGLWEAVTQWAAEPSMVPVGVPTHDGKRRQKECKSPV